MKKFFKMAISVMATVVVVFGMFSCSEEWSNAPEPVVKTNNIEVPVLVERDKLVNIVSNVFFDGKTIVVGDKVAATVDVEHEMPVIEMPSDKHSAATITSSNDMEWRDSNGQNTTGTLNIYDGDNYQIFGTLYPAANYSTLTKVHPKVSVVNTHHTFEGSVNVTVAEETKSKSFNFDLARQYFLVDPTVDVEIINHTDTVTNIVVERDTIINNVTIVKRDTIINNVTTIVHDTITVTNTVTVTDTVTVEVERFVKGADVVKSVVNDFGFSNGTMTLGDKQLLAVEIRHQFPLLSVDKDVLGSANFSNVAALRWDGSDKQITTATVSAQGCQVDGVSYLRSEFKSLVENSLVQVRTIYKVWGTYKNENNDVLPFEMELAPSYVQSYEEVVSENNAPVYRYEVEESYKDKESNGVKTRKLTVKVSKFDENNNVVQSWKLLRNVVISGHVSGYDLYVMNTAIVNKVYTDEDDARPEYNYTNVPIEGNEQFTETMNTHLWRYQNHWVSDAKGDIYTDSHLLFQSCVITFRDGNFTWTSKSFKKDAEVVYDKIDTDSDLVGKTTTTNGRNYTYGGTHRLTVKNIVDGEEFFTSTATSPLWVLNK